MGAPQRGSSASCFALPVSGAQKVAPPSVSLCAHHHGWLARLEAAPQFVEAAAGERAGPS